MKHKLYPLARKGSMAENAKARLLGAEIDTHISITLDAIDLDTSSHDILHTRSDQLLGATRILLASGRLRDSGRLPDPSGRLPDPVLQQDVPFLLDTRWETVHRAKANRPSSETAPAGKPSVPQPERRNEIFPTTEEVGDPSASNWTLAKETQEPEQLPYLWGIPLEYPTKNPATQPHVVWIYESGASRPA